MNKINEKIKKLVVLEVKRQLSEQYRNVEYQDESSLEGIAGVLGLTLKNVQELILSSERKIRSLTKDEDYNKMGIKEYEKLLSFIREKRKDVATKLANYLKQIDGTDLFKFFAALISNGLMKKADIDYISDKEFKNLIKLSEKSKEDIIDALLKDIEHDNNLFKSFQIALSRTIYS